MDNLITYFGGMRGDFVRLLAFTGLKVYDHVSLTTTDDMIYFNLHTKHGTVHDKFCAIKKENGQVSPLRLMDRTGDNYKKFFPSALDHMKMVGYEKFMSNDILRELDGLAMLYPVHIDSYTCGHDAHTFIDAYGSLKEFNDYVTVLGYDKVYYITTDNKDITSLILHLSQTKNNGEPVGDNADTFYAQMMWYHNIYVEQKREQDVILHMDIVEDRDQLRKFMFDNLPDWDDRNYDIIWDEYERYEP